MNDPDDIDEEQPTDEEMRRMQDDHDYDMESLRDDDWYER